MLATLIDNLILFMVVDSLAGIAFVVYYFAYQALRGY